MIHSVFSSGWGRSRGYDALPERSARFSYAPPGVVRMTCECCGFLTLPLVPDAEASEVDWDHTMLGCVLCGWESGPALEDGTPDPAAASAADRNEGYTLADAQAHFRRHGWMYDPAEPPAWMGEPPTAEETELRSALREAYEMLAAPDESRDRGDAWERVLDAEARLRAAEEAHRAALEERLESEGEWGDEDDPSTA